MRKRSAVVLSDCPECVEDWFPGEMVWRRLERPVVGCGAGGEESVCREWEERIAGWMDEGRPWWRGEWAGGLDDWVLWDYWVVVQDAARSQFDRLCEVAGAGGVSAGMSIACLALEGRGFHGLRERPWVAQRGNLHLSALVGTRLEVQEVGMALSMLPTVAVMDALLRLGGDRLREGKLGIRWVNDVFWNGRKLAGVLTQTQVQGTELKAVILGVGLNVAAAPEVPPSLFVPGVVSWSEVMGGHAIGLGTVTGAVLKALGERLLQVYSGGAAEIWNAYRQHSLVLGKQVRIFLEKDSGEDGDVVWKQGRVVEMDADLGLRLEGVEEAVRRGRLVLVDGEAT